MTGEPILGNFQVNDQTILKVRKGKVQIIQTDPYELPEDAVNVIEMLTKEEARLVAEKLIAYASS